MYIPEIDTEKLSDCIFYLYYLLLQATHCNIGRRYTKSFVVFVCVCFFKQQDQALYKLQYHNLIPVNLWNRILVTRLLHMGQNKYTAWREKSVENLIKPPKQWCSDTWRIVYTLNLCPKCFLKRPVQQRLSALFEQWHVKNSGM